MSDLPTTLEKRHGQIGAAVVTTTRHGQVDDMCRRLYNAMEGIGTDESAVLSALDEANEYGLVGDVIFHWYQFWGTKQITTERTFATGFAKGNASFASILSDQERSLEGWLIDDFSDADWWLAAGAITAMVAITIATGGVAVPLLPAGATIVVSGLYAYDQQATRDKAPFFRLYGGTKSIGDISYWTKYNVTDKNRDTHIKAYRAAKKLYDGMLPSRKCLWCDEDDIDLGLIHAGIRDGYNYCIMEQVRDAFTCFFGDYKRVNLDNRYNLDWWLSHLESSGNFFTGNDYTNILQKLAFADSRKNCDPPTPEAHQVPDITPSEAVPLQDVTPVDTLPITTTNPGGHRHNHRPIISLEKTVFPDIVDNGFITAIPLLLAMSDRFGQIGVFQNEVEIINKFNKLKSSSSPLGEQSTFFKNNNIRNNMNIYPTLTVRKTLDGSIDDHVENFSTKSKKILATIPVMLNIDTSQRSLSQSDPYQMAAILQKIGEEFPNLQGSILSALNIAAKGDSAALNAMCERVTSSESSECENKSIFDNNVSLIEQLKVFCKSSLVDTVAVRNKIIKGQLAKDEHLIINEDNKPTIKAAPC